MIKMNARSAVALCVSVLVCASLPLPPAGAEATATVETRTIVSSRALRGVSFVGERGWAVGESGTILTTTDRGATWTARSSGITADLHDVDFVDEQHGWAVGAGGTIVRTEDGGASWVNQPTGIGASFLSVDFVDRQHGWAVGSDPILVSTILATSDGGKTWTRQAAQGAAGLVDVAFFDAQRGIAVGYIGAVFETDDGGTTWVPVPTPGKTDWAFYSVAIDGDKAIIGAQFGLVMTSDDRGRTWTETFVSEDRSNLTVALDGDTAITAGTGGFLALSNDGGQTWTSHATTTTADLRRAAISGGRGLIVGNAGRLVTIVPHEEGLPELPELPMFVGSDDCEGPVAVDPIDAPPTIPLSVVSADLEGDGNDEIVVGTLDGVTAIEPFAPSEEAEVWHFPLHLRVQDVQVAELDGDAGAEFVAGTLRSAPKDDGILALDGDGGLLWGKEIKGGADRIEIADLDGDEIDDIAGIGEAHAIHLLNGTDGSLLTTSKTLAGEPRDVDLGDLTGDGIADVAAVTSAGSISTFRGGDLTRLWSVEMEGSLSTLHAVEVDDVDGDGSAEVAVGGYGQPSSLTPGSGDGTTSVGSQNGAFLGLFDGADGALRWDFVDPGTTHFRGLRLGDVTGDGVLDVVGHASRIESGYIYALDGRGNPDLAAVSPEPRLLWSASTTRPGSSQFIHSEDISFTRASGDDLADPVVALTNGSVLAFEATPSGAERVTGGRPGESLWELNRGEAIRTVRNVRVDGDDYVLALSEDGLIVLLESGSGERAWSFGTGRHTHVAGIDSDGDGDEEIALGESSGSVRVIESDGAGVGAAVFMPGAVVGIAGSDLDGDGDDEIVVADDVGTAWALEPGTGERLWEASIPNDASTLAVGGGTALVAARPQLLVGLDLDTGAELWRQTLATNVNSIAYDDELGSFVVAAAQTQTLSGSLSVISTGGEVVERIDVADPNLVRIGDIDGDPGREIMIASGFSVRAFDADLSLLWALPFPLFVSSLTLADLDGDGVQDASAMSAGEIYGIDGSTGLDLWHVPGGSWSLLTPIDMQGDGDDEIFGFTPRYGGGGLIEVGAGNVLRALDGDGELLATCDLVRGPADLISVDVDGDGYDEVVSGGEVGGAYLFTPIGREVDPDPTPTLTPTPDEDPIDAALEILGSTDAVVQYSDEALLEARLSDRSTGDPLSGVEVTFLIEGHNGYRSFSAPTNSDGVASVTRVVDLRPGDFVLTVGAEVEDTQASADRQPFVIEREDVDAAVEVTGKGANRMIHATLSDADDASGLASRLVHFFVDGELVGKVRTDWTGNAYLELPKGAGPGRPVEAVFEGDDFYRRATATTTT